MHSNGHIEVVVPGDYSRIETTSQVLKGAVAVVTSINQNRILYEVYGQRVHLPPPTERKRKHDDSPV